MAKQLIDLTTIGLVIGDLTIVWIKQLSNNGVVSQSGHTLTPRGDGIYVYSNPNITEDADFKIEITADDTKYAVGYLSPADGDIAQESNSELHTSNAINNTIPLYERADGTLVADGTEQTIYEVTPTVTLVPDSITMSVANMVDGDAMIIRMYAKLKSGGSYELIDSQVYSGVKEIPAINITGQPNRYGWKVTLEQTGGTYRDYDWERYTLTT